MKKILFVCLGNICRSPLAEGIAKRIAKEQKIELCIDSAGIGSWHTGELPCDTSIKIAMENKIDISMFCARQVVKNDKEKFDFIIAVDRQNISDLKSIGFRSVYLLGDYACYQGRSVPDPYYFKEKRDKIKEVYLMIESCVKDILKRIKDENL